MNTIKTSKTSKTRKNTELAAMVESRLQILDEIGELKYKQRQQEEAIIIDLLRSNDTQYLSVNWNRLNRAYRGW